jgi:phosphoglycerate dehydrogenase-like enzyme
MQVVFCGTGWFPVVDEIRARLPAGAAIRVRDPGRPVVDELRGANVILPSNCRIDRAAIEAPRALRLIQQPAAGIDGVDLAAARDRGVPVCNAPGMNAASVAEAALLLILALARRVPAARRAFAERRIGVPLGFELAGKTLGIVGLGRSGTALARAAEGLGMRVVSVGSASGPDDFARLLAGADVVSVHCPLTPATRGLFGDDAFARMKPGALLVNCARGAIIDRGALERALAAGRLGGVGLDTYWAEPWDPDDPLFARDDVVTLPHTAGSTAESFARIAAVVADNVARVMRGDEPLHRII